MSAKDTEDSDLSRSNSRQPTHVIYPPGRLNTIDLFEIVSTLWRGKWLLAGNTLLFVISAVAYVLLAQPIFRAEVLLASNEPEGRAGLASRLGDIGGLASLAGINLDSASADRTEAIAMLRSRVIVEQFINENDLLPLLFSDDWDASTERWIEDDPAEQPDVRDGIEFFRDEVSIIVEDPATGLVTLAIEWTDPQTASDWAEQLVVRVNERLRARDLADSSRRLEFLNAQLESANLVELRQAISRLIESEIQTMTLAQVETEYAFRAIDPPRPPKKPVRPQRVLVVGLATVIGALFGMLVVWVYSGRWRSGGS